MKQEEQSAIYFIESSLSGYVLDAIIQARNLGLYTHFLSKDFAQYSHFSQKPELLADESHRVDTEDIASMLLFFHDKKGYIQTFTDYHLLLVASLQELLGRKNPMGLQAIMTCRFKNLTREFLKKETSRFDFQFIRKTDKRIVTQLQPPYVVKPIDASGSMGVKRCENGEELFFAVENIRGISEYSSTFDISGDVLVETYIGGEEFSAELIWDTVATEWKLLGFTQKFLSKPPLFVEIGHLFPYHFDAVIQEKITAEVKMWLNKIGLRNCVAHVEFKVEDGIPYLIEVNPRFGGDHISRLIELATGVNLIAESIKSLMGLEIDVNYKKTKKAMIRYLLPQETGRIRMVNIPQKTPSCIVDYEFKPIGYLCEKLKSSRQRLGYAIACGEESQDLQQELETFLEEVEVIC